MKVLVTGASGFIGKHLLERLRSEEEVEVYGASRKPGRNDMNLVSPELSGNADWSGLLYGIDVVVHTAARSHVLNELSRNPLDSFRKVNVEGTLSLARQAARSGVARFLYISSIGVNGANSRSAFSEKDTPEPWGDYAQSKLEAEVGLLELAKELELEVVIIRPPLVYGPNAPGNFGLLTKVVAKGMPLPLAKISNRRSFISVWNLVDLIAVCLDHPKATGEVFVVCDGNDVSTSELLQKIGTASGHSVRLFWVPSALLKAGVMLLRKREIHDRLFGSLQVDDSHVRKTLGWKPPLSLEEGLRRCFIN